MGADYIPGQELAMNAWAANFAACIAVAPATYGLTAADAAAITAAQGAFGAALTRATDPLTRTVPSVADKEDKKAAMLVLLRHYAQTLKRNRGLSNQIKATLGLTIDRAGKSRRPAPATAPVLALQRLERLGHTLSYADAGFHPAKPVGVVSLQLYRRVRDRGKEGVEGVEGTGGAEHLGMFTKQPIRLRLASADAGRTAYYFGCWVTRSGLTGPVSAVIEAPIVA